jgi:O-antigen ligase
MPLIITRIHHLFSVRDPIVGRVSGLAYEPSWLGNQLMVLYVPLLAAATIERQSVFPGRRGWLSAESIMLVWAVAVLLLTKSRISLVSFLALASIALVTFGGKKLWSWQRKIGLAPSSAGRWRRLGLMAVNGLVLVALVVGLLLGAASIASQTDARLWALESLADRATEIRAFYPGEVLVALGAQLAFAERIVYWTSAFRTFSLYPVLGVGPGNAGFLFERTLPDYGFRLTEIQELLREPSFGFPNPKNLWGRILAETGLVGFVLFSWWFVTMGLGAAALWRKGAGLQRYLGLAGVLAFITQVVEGFSLDTYALPQLWLVFGLTTAALWTSPELVGGSTENPASAGSDVEVREVDAGQAFGRPRQVQP